MEPLKESYSLIAGLMNMRLSISFRFSDAVESLALNLQYRSEPKFRVLALSKNLHEVSFHPQGYVTSALIRNQQYNQVPSK